MLCYGMVWYAMVRYGMVWYGVVRYGMVWYGMVWYGMIWYGMGPLVSVCRRGWFFDDAKRPRLHTGESMHLVYFWPSPISRARWERQRGESGVRWWVGTVRLSVSIYVCAEGVDLLPTTMLNDPILANPVSAWTKNCLPFVLQLPVLFCATVYFLFWDHLGRIGDRGLIAI
jgi:hypothetical protein